MINTRVVEEVLLLMVVGEKMPHGDKPGSPGYDSLTNKYGSVIQCIVNTYSLKPH